MNNVQSFKNLERNIASNSDVFDNWLECTDIITKVPMVWDNSSNASSEISTSVYS